MPLTIAELVHEAHTTARSKGWHEGAEALAVLFRQEGHEAVARIAEADRFGALMALIHSEVSEAMEAYRTHRMAIWHREDGKPEGVPAELADVVIRIADVCGFYGIDLADAIVEKMAFNRTRAYRHGGKTL